MDFDYDEECWLRTVRRNMLLLCVVHLLNRKLDAVSVDEVRNFMSFLEIANPEIYRNIVKPNRPLEYTIEEFSRNNLIILDGECIRVNVDKISSEEDLMYWESFGEELEGAYNEYVHR